MRITDVQASALAVPLQPPTPPSPWSAWWPKQVIVRVFTDAGLVGLGEAFPYGAPLAVCNVVEEGLAPLLRDQDPRRIEYLADLMQRAAMNYGRRGLGMFAISGVEIALWDLLGKIHQAPVYELLGGAVRTRFEAYASLMRYDTPADVATACRTYVGRGYRLLKLHQTDVGSVQAARDAVGPDVGLMLDTNCPWSPAEALAMARALEPYQLAWLEEPVWPPEDFRGLAAVTRSSPIPIAAGENEATVFGFRELVAHRAVSILQPSICKVGGIGEFRKVAVLAEAANLRLVPHAFYLGPALAATLHVAATLGASPPIEVATGEYAAPFLVEPLAVRDGWIEVPAGPGLGVEVSPEAFERHPYQAGQAQPFLLR
jgi:D-galactarolactone cycloisomerase